MPIDFLTTFLLLHIDLKLETPNFTYMIWKVGTWKEEEDRSLNS